jgi:hypothetical protein
MATLKKEFYSTEASCAQSADREGVFGLHGAVNTEGGSTSIKNLNDSSVTKRVGLCCSASV